MQEHLVTESPREGEDGEGYDTGHGSSSETGQESSGMGHGSSGMGQGSSGTGKESSGTTGQGSSGTGQGSSGTGQESSHGTGQGSSGTGQGSSGETQVTSAWAKPVGHHRRGSSGSKTSDSGGKGEATKLAVEPKSGALNLQTEANRNSTMAASVLNVGFDL